MSKIIKTDEIHALSTSVVIDGDVSATNLSGTNTGDQVVPANEAGSVNNFITAYNSTNGSWSKAQPTWANVDKTTSSIADITTKDHNDLSNKDLAGNHAKLIPSADGTTAIQITKADGTTVILNIDSSNKVLKVYNKLEVYDNDNTTLREFIDNNGFKQVRYRDEYVSGPWVEASGAAAPDLVNVTIGGVGTRKYAFDGSATEERLSNSFEIPHDIALTEVNNDTLFIEWHVHFRPSTNNSGDVKWFLDYCYSPFGGAPIAQTSASFIKSVSANQQYFQLVEGVEIPKPVGGWGIGGIITFNLRRSPSDVQDTYPDDVLLVKTALHVPVNDSGSRQRYIK